jgi:hypothetical protein
MSLRERLARFLFADVIEAAITAAISVRVDDSSGWSPLSGTGPQDRPWGELFQDLQDALEAWQKNFFVRRIVTLTRSYVVAGGISISSTHAEVDRFVRAFWTHPANHMETRLGPICDELTRAGEIFPVLFTNRVDGMSSVRFVPASQILQVEADPDDYELELRYQEAGQLGDARWWLSADHPDARQADEDGSLPPIMLHYAVNRPIGATRGQGDLGPVLPWALRYSKWLEDRVRLNRIRTRQGILDVTIADDTQVEAKRRALTASDPIEAGIYVHGPGEEVKLHELKIGADDAKEDGRALRLAISAGANAALHYLGEGEHTNYATAKEMGEPTARFFTERQTQLTGFLVDLVQVAYDRKVAAGKARNPSDYRLKASVAEVARADNLSFAQAARDMVEALAAMKANGWIDDKTAVRLAFQFAGEVIDEEQITAILEAAPAPTPPPEEEPPK